MINYSLLAVFVASLIPGAVGKAMGVSFFRIAKWYLYASLFAVVVVLTSTFFPFIGGKYDFFRVTVELALASFILWWAFEASDEAFKGVIAIWKKPLVIAVAIFVAAYLLASLFALDPHAAFWSNYERGEGGFQMIHYFIFFMLAVALLREEKDWRRFFGISLIAAVLMILYGVMSAAILNGTLPLPAPFNVFFIGPYNGNGAPNAPTFWSRLFSETRFQGSLGNPAYVDPYLMFGMFYALWLWVSRKITGATTALYLGLVAVFLVFFVLAATRGTFVGLGVAVVGGLLFVALRSGPKIRTWSLSVLGACIIVGGLLVGFHSSSVVQKLPGSRLFDLTVSADSFSTRLWTWGSAWQGFLDSPKTMLVGWGPENFTAVFDKYFNPKHFIPGQNSETWFDRAHSIIFDYLSETGIIGFLAYLGMFAVFYREFIKRMRSKRAESRTYIYLQALLFVVLIGYLVQGLVLFDVMPIYMNVFMVLAFGTYLFYRAPQEVGFPKLNEVEHTR